MKGHAMIRYDSDWAVSEVGRRDTDCKIPKYKVHRIWKMKDIEYLGDPFTISRNGLMTIIKTDRKKVITVYKKDGEILPGEEVRITELGYLRTDPNEIEEDNLGNLPKMT